MPTENTSSVRLRLRKAARGTVVARVALLPRRYRTARAAGTWSRREVLGWLAGSREYTNFTYPLTPTSERDLGCLIARVLGVDPERVFDAMRELHEDEALIRHIANATRRSRYRHIADRSVHFGRRSGWYALTRLGRPRLVVETGVDKGLGACVFASALLRNASEGAPGRYLGIDIDRDAGWLLVPPYDEVAALEHGDSVTVLRGHSQPIDLFLHDSDHSSSHERAEYEAVAENLSGHAILLTDNAHVTDELSDFAHATGREFVVWHETPQAHWYPGGATGVAWLRRGEYLRATTCQRSATTSQPLDPRRGVRRDVLFEANQEGKVAGVVRLIEPIAREPIEGWRRRAPEEGRVRRDLDEGEHGVFPEEAVEVADGRNVDVVNDEEAACYEAGVEVEVVNVGCRIRVEPI
jgi:predicted O-methyltransferase YrrM